MRKRKPKTQDEEVEVKEGYSFKDVGERWYICDLDGNFINKIVNDEKCEQDGYKVKFYIQQDKAVII
jgi:hypothetical protein